MVEFALALPVLLLLLFGLIEFARIFQSWLSIQNGARFGVRYAVTGEFNPAYCGLAGGALGYSAADNADGQTDCRVQPSYGGAFEDMTNELIDWARIPSIRDVARAAAVAILKDSTAVVGQPQFFKVTICSSRDANEDGFPNDFVFFPPFQQTFTPATCQPREDAGAPGDRVTIALDFNHPLILPLVSTFWPQVHLVAVREGVVERYRTSRVINLPMDISLPTYTPTITLTPPPPTPTLPPPSPTATATPDCSLVYPLGVQINGSSFEFQVRNSNVASAQLIRSILVWPTSWGMYFDNKQFNNIIYYDVNSSISPVDVLLSSPQTLSGNTSPTWRARFANWPASITSGYFSGDLTFEFPDWGNCPVFADLSVTATATPTSTRTPTATTPVTPTRTRTASATAQPTRTPTRTATITQTPTETLFLSPTPTTPPPPPTPSGTPTIPSTPTPTITFNLDG